MIPIQIFNWILNVPLDGFLFLWFTEYRVNRLTRCYCIMRYIVCLKQHIVIIRLYLLSFQYNQISFNMLSAVSFLSPEHPAVGEINILKTRKNDLRDNYRSEQSHLKICLKECISEKIYGKMNCIAGILWLIYLNFWGFFVSKFNVYYVT